MPSPKPLPSTPKQSLWTWLLVLVTGISLFSTAVYAASLASSTGTLGKLITSVASPTTAVRILRILSEATSLLFVALINVTLDEFIWTAASSEKGITMSTLLSVSSSTSVFGLLELFTWNAVGLHHISVLLRLLSLVLIPVMGIVILATVNFITMFVPQHTFDVSAGIGFFNGSQALDFTSDEVSFMFATTFNYVLVDTTWGTRFNSSCPGNGAHCLSYYFPGSTSFIFPSPGGFDNADIMVVPNVQGLRIDFWDVDDSEFQSIDSGSFDDCPIYGGTQFGYRVCISPSTLNVDHLIIAWWICPYYDIGQAGGCLSNSSWYGNSSLETVTSITAMQVTRHTFDAEYSRTNQTILSVTNVRPPAANQTISPEGIYTALGQVFGVNGGIRDHDNSTTATLIEAIWSSVENTNGQASNAYQTLLQAMITTPILLFNPNGINADLAQTPVNSTQPGLPADLYTTATYVEPIGRVTIQQWTVVVYLVIALSMYIFCIGLLAWGMRIQRPPASRFPLVDFTARTLSKGFTADSLATLLVELTGGEDEEIRKKLWSKVLYLGDVDQTMAAEDGTSDSIQKEVGKIGFSLVKSDVSPLKAGEVYE